MSGKKKTDTRKVLIVVLCIIMVIAMVLPLALSFLG